MYASWCAQIISPAVTLIQVIDEDRSGAVFLAVWITWNAIRSFGKMPGECPGVHFCNGFWEVCFICFILWWFATTAQVWLRRSAKFTKESIGRHRNPLGPEQLSNIRKCILWIISLAQQNSQTLSRSFSLQTTGLGTPDRQDWPCKLLMLPTLCHYVLADLAGRIVWSAFHLPVQMAGNTWKMLIQSGSWLRVVHWHLYI